MLLLLQWEQCYDGTATHGQQMTPLDSCQTTKQYPAAVSIPYTVKYSGSLTTLRSAIVGAYLNLNLTSHNSTAAYNPGHFSPPSPLLQLWMLWCFDEVSCMRQRPSTSTVFWSGPAATIACCRTTPMPHLSPCRYNSAG
jgi:hypothetical protein